MDKRIRFTDRNPPPKVWDAFPNWENAYDEEGKRGQDETTLRPAGNQVRVDDDVSFTAGDAVFESGQRAPALLNVLGGELDIVYVYPDPKRDECWAVRFDPPSGRWTAMNGRWFLELKGVIPVPLDDPGVFPIRVASRLPLERSGEVIEVEIARPE